MVQKVYGGEKPVPLWLEDNEETSSSLHRRLLFSLVIRIKVCCCATIPHLSILSNMLQFVRKQPHFLVCNLFGEVYH